MILVLRHIGMCLVDAYEYTPRFIERKVYQANAAYIPLDIKYTYHPTNITKLTYEHVFDCMYTGSNKIFRMKLIDDVIYKKHAEPIYIHLTRRPQVMNG